jgi:hypothetical protein
MKFIIVIGIFIIGNAFAGESARVGNGGGFLSCEDGRTVLLDFYEAEYNALYTFKQMKTLDSLQRSKLFDNRIRLFDPDLADFLVSLRIFFHEKKSIIQNATFKIPDDFLNLYHEQTCELEVVAVQRKPILSIDKIFFLNHELWYSADKIAQEGLVNHELLYFISLHLDEENSRSTREALAYLMSDQFNYNNSEEFQKNFYYKITNGGFFPRFKSFARIICRRIKAYGFNCNSI